jgi:hypothetical protein
MKEFHEVSPSIQVMVEGYAINDPYGLQPSTLYNNIVGSLKSSTPEKVAKIFAVSVSLCEMIEKENKDEH